ncbi:sulfur carrier protein [Limimonas halophila]|uniref:Sulfur carrier protein n=1 Tax=Limimonas halophila TaxID=1082479 RepID=A0A1G7P3C6_9PROT|nr:sulfur carrier protein ThiS [Limimonas halophila]SDF80741.1 sulfur carrier protein [Limimonas halophila]
MSASSSITVNGEARDLAERAVREIVEHEGLDPERRGLAVAVDGAVVPRRDWATTHVPAGGQVEIVKPFAGG